MAPQVGPVGDRLVVDFDDAVGHATGERRTYLAFQFEDAGAVLADPQLRGAGQHTVALHTVDRFLADRRVRRNDARAAVGRAADHSLTAITAGIHYGGDVPAGLDRFDRFHACRARLGQQRADCLDAFAF